mgnify:CR=1 FL=1
MTFKSLLTFFGVIGESTLRRFFGGSWIEDGVETSLSLALCSLFLSLFSFAIFFFFKTSWTSLPFFFKKKKN